MKKSYKKTAHTEDLSGDFEVESDQNIGWTPPEKKTLYASESSNPRIPAKAAVRFQPLPSDRDSDNTMLCKRKASPTSSEKESDNSSTDEGTRNYGVSGASRRIKRRRKLTPHYGKSDVKQICSVIRKEAEKNRNLMQEMFGEFLDQISSALKQPGNA